MFSVVAAPVINKFEALVLAPVTVQGWCSVTRSASKRSIRRSVITEKAPTRATTAFTFKTLLRHYAKQTSLNVKLGPRRKGHKGRAVWLA